MAIVDVLNQNKIESLVIDQRLISIIIGLNKDYLVLVNKKEEEGSCLIIYKIEKKQVGLNLNQFSFILNLNHLFLFI